MANAFFLGLRLVVQMILKQYPLSSNILVKFVPCIHGFCT